MQYHQVESSMMSLIGYDEEEQILNILFNSSGQMYEYYDVPKEVFEEFLASDSKGRHFLGVIRDYYHYSKFRK